MLARNAGGEPGCGAFEFRAFHNRSEPHDPQPGRAPPARRSAVPGPPVLPLGGRGCPGPKGGAGTCLRHTMATRLAEDGASASEIQHILGHQSLNTSQVYIDATANEQRAAVRANRTYRPSAGSPRASGVPVGCKLRIWCLSRGDAHLVRAENSIRRLKQPVRTHGPGLQVGRIVEGGPGQLGSLGPVLSPVEVSAGRGSGAVGARCSARRTR